MGRREIVHSPAPHLVQAPPEGQLRRAVDLDVTTLIVDEDHRDGSALEDAP
jgi:hypothetical protein